MRLIDADELIEHAWRDKLDSRELIAQMIENAPTVKTEKTPKEIEQQIKNFAEKMYQAGYADSNNTNLIDEAYQEGLNDAWECFKKLVYPVKDGGFSTERLCEIFGTSLPSHIIRDFSPSEAIQKIKDYEERKKQKDAEICVGDEVYTSLDENFKYIVTRIYRYDELVANLLSQNGTWGRVMKLSNLHKTGKHYDAIEEVLKELRRDESNADSN